MNRHFPKPTDEDEISKQSSSPMQKKLADSDPSAASFLQQPKKAEDTAPQPATPAPNTTPPTSAVPTAAATKGVKGKKHVVKPGENLSKISQQYYGTENNWIVIYNANKAVIGDNPNVIRAGIEIVIPKI